MADLTAAVKALEKVHDESDRETKLANAMIWWLKEMEDTIWSYIIRGN